MTQQTGVLRNQLEQTAAKRYAESFINCSDSIETRLENFTKYVRLQNLTRFLARYELFKNVLDIKGSIIECGVYHGFGIMAWANLSAILEPVNLTRRVYGFDTFEGFPSIHEKDEGTARKILPRELCSDSYNELLELIDIYDNNRYLGHMKKIYLIKGDATKTIPKFIAENTHIVVSLLFLDFDLYEPTKTAINAFLPRMPKGAVIAFDELDNPLWPGETLSLLDTVGINALKIKRLDFDPYIGYAVIE